LLKAIQNVLTNNSPLNNAKIALVKSLAGEYDQAQVRSQLDSWITEKPVLMLSFQTCPFCIKAKSILDNKKAKYHVVELDVDPNGKAIRAEMANLTGRTSVPAIFINGNFVGGCNDGGPNGNTGIVQLDQTGELDSMLRAVGAI
jgi:glutaredoxin 3